MKRVLSFLLTLILIFSFSNINTFAVFNEELLVNGDFENGTIENFSAMAKSSYEVGSAYAHDGNYGLLIKNRQEKYATYYQEILPVLRENGAGVYNASLWIKLANEYNSDTSCVLVIRVMYPNNVARYYTSNKITLKTSWQKCTLNSIFEIPDDVISVIIYQQSFDVNDNAPDVCVDSMSLTKVQDSHFDEETLTAPRTPDTTVGAIRWDAWYGYDGKEGSIVSQVERSLSPSQFHFRAPFFAEITDENKVIIPKYTQAIFDREMEYAIYAGIDYFSYVWYKSDMKTARKFHEQSKYRNDVKMCVCFDNNAIGQDYAREEMRTLLKEDYYMTVLDGRPLMYYSTNVGNIVKVIEDILYYEKLCEEIGVKKPFTVLLNGSFPIAKGAGSADSKYAVWSNTSFEQLVEKCQDGWLTYNNNKFQYVPNVTTGWHPEPRYINPVSWATTDNNTWAGYASDIEILDHFAYALSYLQHDEVKPYTKANTILAYAWNEHDEGGWICPTLEVDENGNQLYNEDGSKKLNENRINAVKEAIEFFKSGNLVEVTVNGVSNGSTIKKASETIENLSQKLSANVYEGLENDVSMPKIQGATLDIGSSLTLNYHVDSPFTEKMTMRFTSSSGYVTEVKGTVQNKYSVFSYKGINPQCMNDFIKAELISNGKVIDVIENYSVKTYCDNLIANEDSLNYSSAQLIAFKSLIADMLSYGAASQEYRNYNTENPADASAWVNEYKTIFHTPNGVRNITGNADSDNRVTAMGVNVSNVNSIYFKLKLTDAVSVTLNDREIDLSMLLKNDDGTVTLYSNDIYATGFNDVYTLKLVKDDVVITTVQYNVNAYINKMHENTNAGKIVKALSNYGTSAINFKNSLIPDIDFDLEDDNL